MIRPGGTRLPHRLIDRPGFSKKGWTQMALDQGIIRFDPEGPPGRGLEPMVESTPDMVVEGFASELCHNYYTSPSGLLEGGMTLTDDTGTEHSFSSPDVLLEFPDTVSAWTSTENVRKYYCIFEE
jgi:hypothetical protein